ncbi:MAG: trehalase family glycosidase [Elusimicrobia bacterium]|nr:trehalase family glycosidase [Elusimicrobiota bacterium]
MIRSLALSLALLLAAAPAGASELSAFFTKHKLKENIVKPPQGLLKHAYIVPAGPYFQLFDWDMYFMAAALSYDQVSAPIVGSVKDFLAFVDEFANWTGYTPREIAPDALWALPEMCKPFLAQAAVRASLTAGDFQWLRQSDPPPSADPAYLKLQTYERPDAPPRIPYYRKLQDTLAFWENNRRAADGLFVWFNGVESGTDNSPAVSDSPSQVTEGVDLQCYIYREYLALALIAERLGEPKAAAAFRAKAAALKDLVNGRMWSEADGLYWNIDSRTGQPVKVKAWTSFVPLWAKVAPPERAKRMIEEHLLNEAEFWSPHGVRTLARGEPLYDAKAGYWRGPVWVISNYLMMHGLRGCGYKKQARELARKTVRLLVADFKKSGGMNENYDPETGAPAANGRFVSWNLLAERMEAEAASGQDPTAIPER